MSWIKNLAGKAEGFLNELDNSAAHALKQGDPNYRERDIPYQPITNSISYTDPTLNFQSEIYVKRSPLAPSSRQASPSPILSSNKLKSKDPDEDLIQYLNHPSDQVATISVLPSSLVNTNSDESLSNASLNIMNPITSMQVLSSNYSLPKPASMNNLKFKEDQNVEYENMLLKDEISSLNEEIKSLLQRNQRSEEELRSVRQELNRIQTTLVSTESKCRELLSAHEDFEIRNQNQIREIQSFQSLLQQRDYLLEAERNKWIQMEKERLDEQQKSCSQAAVNKESQLSVIEDLRLQINKMNDQLRIANNLKQTNEKELFSFQQSFEQFKMEQEQVKNGLLNELSTLREQESKLSKEVRLSEERYNELQREHREYRDKATKILQNKDKIINNLKGQAMSMNPESGNNELQLHNDSVSTPWSNLPDIRPSQEEYSLLCDELDKLRDRIECRESELQQLSSQAQMEKEMMRKKMSELQTQLNTEKQLRNDCEEDLKQMRKEQQFLQERVLKHKNEFHDHLSEKDKEIERLRGMIVVKQHQDSNFNEELEERIRTLTEAVIQKQMQIDGLKADKHSLQERLNKSQSEKELLEQQNISLAARSNRLEQHLGQEMIHGTDSSFISIDSLATQGTASARSRTMGGSSHSADTTPVAYVKRAALRSADALGRRLGMYTRRYPAIRVLILLYILALHVLVSLLLSSNAHSNALAANPGLP